MSTVITHKQFPNHKTYKMDLCGRPLTIDVGKVAELASASAMVTYGETTVLVAVTALIPVFGAFIGCAVGAFLILLVSPLQCLYFVIFIFILQQFDGNILGPLILGDKLGLPSLAILFSVCVGGGLFGIVGMFIGVPTFAVLYYAIKELIDYRLEKKQIKPHELELKE